MGMGMGMPSVLVEDVSCVIYGWLALSLALRWDGISGGWCFGMGAWMNDLSD